MPAESMELDEGSQESLTPYQFGGNNPVRYNDPDGKCPWCIGAIVGAAVEYASQVTTNLVNGKSLGESLTNVDGTAILISAGAGVLTGGAASFIPKGTPGKLLQKGAALVIDAGESAFQQYNRNRDL